jgi:hypothetical protein
VHTFETLSQLCSDDHDYPDLDPSDYHPFQPSKDTFKRMLFCQQQNAETGSAYAAWHTAKNILF